MKKIKLEMDYRNYDKINNIYTLSEPKELNVYINSLFISTLITFYNILIIKNIKFKYIQIKAKNHKYDVFLNYYNNIYTSILITSTKDYKSIKTIKLYINKNNIESLLGISRMNPNMLSNYIYKPIIYNNTKKSKINLKSEITTYQKVYDELKNTIVFNSLLK